VDELDILQNVTTTPNINIQIKPIVPMKIMKRHQRFTALLVTMLGILAFSQSSKAAITLTLTQDGPDVVISLGGQTHIATATSNLGPGFGSSSGQISDSGGVFLFGTIGFQGQYNFSVAATMTDWLLLNTQTVNVAGVGAFAISSSLISFGGIGVTPTGLFDYDLDATKQTVSARVLNTLIGDMTDTPSGTTIWTGGGGEVVLNIGSVPEPGALVLVCVSGGSLLLRRRRKVVLPG
jgi:hypothetical protein